MACKLTQMPCEFCLVDCGMYTPIVDTENFYAYNKPVKRTIILSCEYESLCKMWYTHYEKQKKNVTYALYKTKEEID